MRIGLRTLSLLVLAFLCCGASTAAKKKTAPVRLDNTQVINGHWFVDLGLPSGLLWADANVGAGTPINAGSYFAWGETTPKSSYGMTKVEKKYQSRDFNLEPKDDAATANWGAPCRMPVYADIEELLENCTIRDTLLIGDSLEFVKCKILKSNINGNEICMPVAGYREGPNVYLHKKLCVYWGNSRMGDMVFPCFIALDNKKDDDKGNEHTLNLWLHYGLPVRPVSVPLKMVTPDKQKKAEKQQPKVATRTDNSKVVNGHKFVDLGLPSGILWAETNIGATTDADCGDYFAYGETRAKQEYSPDTYKYENGLASLSEEVLTDSIRILKKEYDAAYANWGAPCRMPSLRELEELKEYCELDLEAKYDSNDEEVRCLRFTSKINGNHISIPLSGFKRYNFLFDKNTFLFYFTADQNEESRFGLFQGGLNGNGDININSYDGLIIRPVIGK